VSSADSFLIPALRLSCSLANEICKVLESGRSPSPGVDWIDSILVYSQPNNDNLKGGGIEDLTNDDDIRVEILPSLFKKTDINDDVRQVDGILHSLGIVFYELFSRGERPAELEQKQTGETISNSEFENVVNGELSEDFDPFHDDGTHDFPGDVNEIQNLLSYYNLSFDDSTAYGLAFQGGDGPRKKRVQNGNYHMCSVSVEPLKEKGVPMCVCDLIANMLDCANGTLSTDETYHDMPEVRDDLQLMLDKPSIYFYDQDIGMLSSNGLQIGDIMFDRNAELSIIKKAYRRTVSGGNELVTIYGKSGTGKSTLALEFGEHVLSDGGVFLFGKFDQRQQGKPLSALA